MKKSRLFEIRDEFSVVFYAGLNCCMYLFLFYWSAYPVIRRSTTMRKLMIKQRISIVSIIDPDPLSKKP